MSDKKIMTFLKNWWDKRKKKIEEKKAKKPQTFKEKVLENVKVFFSAYLIAFFIRLFLIEGYQIPSQSMVPTLRVKDILMVQKLSLGAIVPLTRWKVFSFGKPRHNDIIVFVTPNWENPGLGREFISLITLSLINLDNTPENPKNLVKRLVAVPGDTLMMTNKTLYLNGKPFTTTYIGSKNQILYDRQRYAGYRTFDLYEESYDDKKRIVQHEQASMDKFLMNYQLNYQFPEITVPEKGKIIDLRNINRYYQSLMVKLIERETGENVAVDSQGNLVLSGKILTEWIPKDDYYFAMGDNRDASFDCRYFGFIPRKNIFGRIMFRYYPFKRFGFKINEKADKVMKVDFTK